MKREEKDGVITAIRERFEKASVALLATNRGLTVAQANRLRQTLRRIGGEYKVAKHTLTRRALEETRYRELGKLLRGPQGLVFGFTDPVAVAKALVDFSNEVDRLQIDGGAVEGQVVAADGVKALASMPDLPSLQRRLAGLMRSPADRVAAMALAPAQRLAGAIATLVKGLEDSGS